MNLRAFGLEFHDLYNPERLAQLTEIFDGDLERNAPELFEQYDRYRRGGGKGFSEVETSALLIDVGSRLSVFLARLFGVEQERNAMLDRAAREQTIFKCKKEFFVRRVLKKYDQQQAAGLDALLLDSRADAILSGFDGLPSDDRELALSIAAAELLRHERFAKTALPHESLTFARNLRNRLLLQEPLSAIVAAGEDEPALRKFLQEIVTILEQWYACHYFQKNPATASWVTFAIPHSLDYSRLVAVTTLDAPVPGVNAGDPSAYRRRDGFDLTDKRFSPREVMSEADYCIFCHERNKDSCSKGFSEGEAYRKNPLGYPLKGCPLDQKISESQLLKSRGDSIGALAVIMIDNPLLPGTGHRICNDCMKACIYQKQDPVNIPQIETGILTDVLGLPWGFELYSLLTRWNPLNIVRSCALPYNGVNILVVGLGPAGYALAHYFLNEGFGVVAIDGLKIEPLPPELVGDATRQFLPLKDYASITSRLSERVLLGFGGVSEYGITVRWDKNFLMVLYLVLARRAHFAVYDGVRFGGTVTVEDAWRYGFDHLCVATGAGKPTFVSMKNNLIRGIRKASDFLMALQLTGAGKRDSMANLQVQLPAVVIGGGLTAIDTATELMAYYPVQVERISRRYRRLVEHYGREYVDGMFDPEERKILERFLAHARGVEEERERAEKKGEAPNFIPLIRSWGGVHIYYRKSMLDSPAYRLNHEEIIKSLQEGITFVEWMSPLEAVPDEHGAVNELVFERMQIDGGKWKPTGETYRVPARTVMIAAGTVPNVMYERERPGTFALDEWNEFFQSYRVGQDEDEELIPTGKNETGFFTSYHRQGRFVTFYGDNHPHYAGNVVKAMASAKDGYRQVLPLLSGRIRQESTRPAADRLRTWHAFVGHLDDELRARVVAVHRVTPTITEIVVRAKKAAREFQPGQFYRLQNYEVDSARVEDALMMMEGVALTGAWVDKEEGTIGLIALEVGASTRMCAFLKPGQHVVVMGPTGSPTEITESGTVLLLGGGLGNAVLFSIAKAFKEKRNRVIYFAGYRKKEDLFKREEIEAATDLVVYSVDAGAIIDVRRPQDRSVVGNIVQALLAYARGELGSVPIPLSAADRVIAIGSDRMMAAVAMARHDALRAYLRPDHVGIASINSPMQCMMKAVCAQCLQRHLDLQTGKEEFVFTCVNQDQRMDEVDFGNLNARLKANSLMEKMTNRWLDYILEKHSIERV